MRNKEKINLVYIDDNRDEGISSYLDDVDDGYKNDKCDVVYKEIPFKAEEGYESLLNSQDVASANIVLIDSKLFENDNIKCKGKFSGEEFRIILKKVFPFIEVLVISQNGEDKNLGIIPKYRNESSVSEKEHYEKYLKVQLDERINRVFIFRNISERLESNKGIEKFLVEKVIDSLNGINDYENLSKQDIDKLITAFKKIG